MGYTRHWRRPATIPQEAMCAIADDFARLIPPLEDAGVRHSGGNREDAVPIMPAGYKVGIPIPRKYSNVES